MKMNLTNEQKQKIITAIATCIITILSVVFAVSCTISLSVQKANNSEATQKTETSTEAQADTVSLPSINFNNK